MRAFSIRTSALAVGLAITLLTACQLYAQQQPAETVAVSKTYNNSPFDYQIRLLAERAQFRVYRLTYPSPVVTPVAQNNTVPADFYLPKSIQSNGLKYPAVICLHILDGNEPLTDLMCSVLASRGVPAISFKLPYYGERGMPRGPVALADNPKLFIDAVAQAGEDIRRTIDVLASRPEINPERIGITGISLGGIIAATAAGGEPRLHRAGLILAGGDLLQIIYHAHETRPLSQMIHKLPPREKKEVEDKLAEVDPLRFASGLREHARHGELLMINAAEDEVIPRQCTEKLAKACGLEDRVVWLEGLGHYTAMAELPRALRTTADFFAQDLPAGASSANPSAKETPHAQPTALQQLASLVQQTIALLTAEPKQGCCHFADLELSAVDAAGRPITATVRLVRGTQGRFSLKCQLPKIGQVALGQCGYPWMIGGEKTLLAGTKNPVAGANAISGVEPRHLLMLRMAAGMGGSMVLAPEVIQQWISVNRDGDRSIRVMSKEPRKLPGAIHATFSDDNQTPATIVFSVAGMQGKVHFRGWQINTIAHEALFEPPEGLQRREVDESDVHRVLSASFNFAAERLDGARRPDADRKSGNLAVVARDPAGHGLLCRGQGKSILFVSGTPAQMGAAHGTLLREKARMLTERVVYFVGGADTLRSGDWFFDRMAEIQRRTLPHIPPRFLEECDALSKAAGVSQRDGRYANLFPERFHCSGVALRGKATAGGRVLHARVLDYMRDIDLQQAAAVQVFMPEGRHKWMSQGYAGFIGTVTAMNEKGLAIGEMGGGGEGHWDGMPMSLMLRDVMERASTVQEAVDIIRNAPKTCEYYYVVSDKSGDMRALCCLPGEETTVLKPGQQHPRLPHVPEDAVIISADDRVKTLGQRIEAQYGRIDVPKLIDIIKRPVSMTSNLHDAIFAPETLEMWFADAGRDTPACDEPYAHVSLPALIQFYESHVKVTQE